MEREIKNSNRQRARLSLWQGIGEAGITVGDRFCASGVPERIWVVDRVTLVEASHHPLVSLRQEQQPDLVKTVSIGVLVDGEDFRQID